MKKISRWAKRNPRYAQITIVVSFIILNLLGYFTGRSLYELGIMIPGIIFTGTIFVYLIAVILYPERKKTSAIADKNRLYFRRKACDGILATTGFVMMICIANDPGLINILSPDAKAVSVNGQVRPHDSLHVYKTPLAFAASLQDRNGKRLPGKERRKLLKEQIRNIKQADDLSKGAKAGLIALSIVVAAGLLFLVMNAACSLSCSGYDGAAWLVAIGGTGLVVVLLLLVLKSISHKQKKNPLQPVEEKATVTNSP